MINQDELFMKKALSLAEEAYQKGEVPIGAIIVYNNKIIAKGYNQVECLKDSTAHAEMIAMTAAFELIGGKYLMDATLYVTVEPCMMCAGALNWSKISRIVYGASDKKNGISKYFDIDNPYKKDQPHLWPFHPKTIVVKGVLEQECTSLMQNFFKQLR